MLLDMLELVLCIVLFYMTCRSFLSQHHMYQNAFDEHIDNQLRYQFSLSSAASTRVDSLFVALVLPIGDCLVHSYHHYQGICLTFYHRVSHQ